MPTSDATLRAGEMKKALLEQIDRYEEDLKLEEVGEVLEVSDRLGGELLGAQRHRHLLSQCLRAGKLLQGSTVDAIEGGVIE